MELRIKALDRGTSLYWLDERNRIHESRIDDVLVDYSDAKELLEIRYRLSSSRDESNIIDSNELNEVYFISKNDIIKHINDQIR